VGDSTEVIQGLLDKLGVAEAEAERLRASLAAIQTRLMAESALADELAEVLRRCANMLAVQDVLNGMDTRAERGWAEAVLARWGETRRR
jgi:hypothetical protein